MGGIATANGDIESWNTARARAAGRTPLYSAGGGSTRARARERQFVLIKLLRSPAALPRSSFIRI